MHQQRTSWDVGNIEGTGGVLMGPGMNVTHRLAALPHRRPSLVSNLCTKQPLVSLDMLGKGTPNTKHFSSASLNGDEER